ncbi:hotdog domain-containing protein [Fibrella sp. WM1]|uniref:hotdog domain-containing protein n=1 Tax=Fibrella musci TaxID=3242485 RepID=UPI00351FDB08
MVTISSDSLNFTMPIPAGTLVELISRIEQIGRTSLKITVSIFVEDVSGQS